MNIADERPNTQFSRLKSINAYSTSLSGDLVHGLIRCDPNVQRVEPNVFLKQGPRGRLSPIRGSPVTGAQSTGQEKRQWNIRNTFTMRWWNKMIVAGKIVRNWILHPGVSHPLTNTN